MEEQKDLIISIDYPPNIDFNDKKVVDEIYEKLKARNDFYEKFLESIKKGQ